MQPKRTIILAVITLIIIALAVGAGVALQQPAAPPEAPKTVKKEEPLPSEEALKEKLADEQPAITVALTEAYPKLLSLYTINPGKLYHAGEWYGTTLTYYGPDEQNRDTLRVLMQKKNGVWQLSTKPPQIILSATDYPEAPRTVIQDINRPAPLPGTDASPAIN